MVELPLSPCWQGPECAAAHWRLQQCPGPYQQRRPPSLTLCPEHSPWHTNHLQAVGASNFLLR